MKEKVNVPQHSEHQNSQFICGLCGKETLTKVELRQHQEDQHEESLYQCRFCSVGARSLI